MVLMCLQPVWWAHREAKSEDSQETSAPLPPGPPAVRDSPASEAAEHRPSTPSLWWSISHGRGRFTLEEKEIRAQNTENFPSPSQKGMPWASYMAGAL